jgi:AcrR family transcriptional regulator
MPEDTSQPHPRGTARARRPRGSLSPEVILDAAEAIARDGFDALTMRAVATRLGAAPMALYNHFPTK